MLENLSVGNREMIGDINISYVSTQHILVLVLSTKCVNAKLVPKALSALFYCSMIVTESLAKHVARLTSYPGRWI